MTEDKEIEKLNSKSTRGGRRPNAGRKKGQLSPATIERAAALSAFRDRVVKSVDKLFNAQLDLAVGEKYLMVKITEGTGKSRKTWTEIVTDPEDIKMFLDGELDNTETEFYYMTTKPANNIAIDSLLDRTFGKAQQNMKLENDGDNPIIAILKARGIELAEGDGGDR